NRIAKNCFSPVTGELVAEVRRDRARAIINESRFAYGPSGSCTWTMDKWVEARPYSSTSSSTSAGCKSRWLAKSSSRCQSGRCVFAYASKSTKPTLLGLPGTHLLLKHARRLDWAATWRKVRDARTYDNGRGRCLKLTRGELHAPSWGRTVGCRGICGRLDRLARWDRPIQYRLCFGRSGNCSYVAVVHSVADVYCIVACRRNLAW